MGIGSAVRDKAAKLMGKTVKVAHVDTLSPRVMRVRLEGGALVDLEFEAGDKIKINVGDGEMRSYTPSSVDSVAGLMNVVVHVHGESAASSWARALTVGDEVTFVGPTKSLDGTAAAPTFAVFYGDETTIGLAEAIIAGLPEGTPIFGAIETERDDLPAVIGLPLNAVERDEMHGKAQVEHLATLELPGTDGVVFLSGEADSVLALRTALLSRGLTREQLRIKPYWSSKGKAHRKELERTVFDSR